jgi:hypothetical protein
MSAVASRALIGSVVWTVPTNLFPRYNLRRVPTAGIVREMKSITTN